MAGIELLGVLLLVAFAVFVLAAIWWDTRKQRVKADHAWSEFRARLTHREED